MRSARIVLEQELDEGKAWVADAGASASSPEEDKMVEILPFCTRALTSSILSSVDQPAPQTMTVWRLVVPVALVSLLSVVQADTCKCVS